MDMTEQLKAYKPTTSTLIRRRTLSLGDHLYQLMKGVIA